MPDRPPESARTLGSTAGGEAGGPHDTPLLIDAKAAASRLSIGARTLWTLTKADAIPARRIGRRVLYAPAELDAWITLGCPEEPGAALRVRRTTGKGAQR